MSRPAEAAAVALLLVLTALCVGPSLEAPFTFDEQAGIADNRAVRPGGPISAALEYRFSPDQSRPLFFLSLWLDARRAESGRAGAAPGGAPVSRLSPRPFRLTNLALHLACGLLLYLLLRRALGTGAEEASPLPALAGAALFFLHPLQSESIIYIWGRSGILSTLLSLGALLLAPPPRRSAAVQGQAATRWAGAIACASLALLSKEEAIVLPLIAFLWWTLADALPARAALRRAIILAGPVAAFLLARAALLGAVGRQVHARSLAENILGEAVVTLRMAWMFLLPVGQTIDPAATVPPLAIGALALVGCGALLGAGLFLAMLRGEPAPSVAGARKRSAPNGNARLVGAGILIAGVACLIYWMVPLPDLMSERRIYLPMVGGAIAVAGLVRAIAGWKGWRAAPYVAAALAMLLPAPALAARARIWSDSRALWEEAARHAPGKARPLVNLGVLAVGRGDRAEAGRLFDRAVRSEPMNAEARYNRARLRLDAGDAAGAAADLERAVAADPAYLKARINLGIARIRLGQMAGAEDELREVLRIDPEEPRALTNLAEVLRATGRGSEAPPLYRRALASDPEYAHAAARLGVALEAQGDPAGALDAYREYLARGPESAADEDAVRKKIREIETAQRGGTAAKP